MERLQSICNCGDFEDGIRTTKQGVRFFLKHYRISKTIARKPGSGLPPKLSPAVQQVIEDTMRDDDETTATQLQAKLASIDVHISLATIVRNRLDLGWTYRGSAYCQMIRHQNKLKHLEWARTHLHDNFDDVIWSDETTVQLETHRRHCYRKSGEKPRPKPVAKHPVRVHVVGRDSIKTDLTCQKTMANSNIHGEVKRTAEQIIKGVRCMHVQK